MLDMTYDYPFCYVVYFQNISISRGKDDGLSKSASGKGPKKKDHFEKERILLQQQFFRSKMLTFGGAK